MKNKKGQEIVSIMIMGVIAVVIILIIGTWFGYKTDLKECEDYKGYGYDVEIVGDLWDFVDNGVMCLITMEDGTKLPLDDCKTMCVKEAKIK